MARAVVSSVQININPGSFTVPSLQQNTPLVPELPPLAIVGAEDMVIPYDTTRYRCPHCRKSWASKPACLSHILNGCHINPATATCATCRYLREGDYHNGDECVMECVHWQTVKAYRPKNCPQWAAKGKL